MSYKHILVAVDLSDDSETLVEKAADLARTTKARLSFIHVEVVQDDKFTRQIVNSLVEESDNKRVLKESHVKLNELKDNSSYPVENILICCDELIHGLGDAVKEHEVDLIICGHHQGFWHNISSATRKVLNTIPVDLLVVPLK